MAVTDAAPTPEASQVATAQVSVVVNAPTVPVVACSVVCAQVYVRLPVKPAAQSYARVAASASAVVSPPLAVTAPSAFAAAAAAVMLEPSHVAAGPVRLL